MSRGLDALIRMQVSTHWQDFALPVGTSDAWVTAYTLAATSAAGREHGAFAVAAAAALDWLEEARTPGTGWGYNAHVPNDADSTAWAIIALRAWGRRPPPEATDFLTSCCEAAGGFSTYPREATPKPGWSAVAADVTAVAARALRIGLSHHFWQLTDTVTALGLPASYWWTSPLYATAMALECRLVAPVPEVVRRAVAASTASGSFERALLLRSRARLSLPTTALARALVAEQQPDGRWPSAAGLRLSHNDVVHPWSVVDSGAVYRDERGVFTTATVLCALTSTSAAASRYTCVE